MAGVIETKKLPFIFELLIPPKKGFNLFATFFKIVLVTKNAEAFFASAPFY